MDIRSKSRRAFGVNLQRILDSKRMDKQQLAKLIGVTYSTVCAWASGIKYPRIDKIEKMAEIFGIPTVVLTEPYSERDKRADNWLKALFADDPATLAAIDKMSINISDLDDSATLSENTKIMLRTVLKQAAEEVSNSTP